ncbi:voltage-gated potassium channel [Actinopolymorpha cephalotaxi]|uniref:Voltage-gated potassium channel n=1 Tax=Actinopolymorpha cephalotaxi TaxID=504797 RepID=A0A1I3BGN6_9ACTN|nr:potassium channel family protein [Actinopolymorpha cephalotaxi]NYH86354.1 voltage-gated potassium channel [Actinopolymorpha cephalotaxi]SFH60901.1 voltage-gated potassium channel [Actinopolymorpha cephalotaxi]
MPVSPLYLLRRLVGSERWQHIHVKASVWAVVGVVAVLLLGSAIIVPAESSNPRANITSFPLALWWSIETATTVGYGDLYPVTLAGRIIATVVMIVGIAAFSIVTASLATWFVGSASRRAHQVAQAVEHAEREGTAAAARELHALHARFDHLEQLLSRDSGDGTT